MRTKILLTAAAAMVAGLVSSNAQVYSANIVGYVNYTSSTTSPKYELIANPLDNGSNTLASVFSKPAGGSSLTIWTGSGFGLIATFTAGHWKTNGVTADNYVLPPGTGVFAQWSAPYTNTFVGQVDPVVGATNTTVLPAGYQLVSSLVPYADYVTNTGTVNITGVTGGTTITEWDTANQSFDLLYTFTAGHWKLGGVNNTPQLGIGQGFFFNAAAPYNWTQVGP
ncbi:MAG: hypothetical protein WBN22_00600 [Verrucomicrobiia bacterium]